MKTTRDSKWGAVTAGRCSGAELRHVMASFGDGGPPNLHGRVAEVARRTGAQVVHEVLFGFDGGAEGRPLTRVGDVPAYPAEAAAVHATLVKGGNGGARVRPGIGSASVARWRSDAAEFCLLSNVQAADMGGSSESQARQVCERIEADLQAAGMAMRFVVRTWFYLDRITDWYETFNRVRTEFYRNRGMTDGHAPASTGVGAALSHGKAVVADVLAVRPTGGGVTVAPVTSPLQCPAQEYGSSFSRAVEIAGAGARTLLISGTASIGADGRTVHPGDTSAQIRRTLEVVEAILESKRMGWNDVTRSVAYLADIGERRLWERHRGDKGMSFPAAVTQCDICRRDLLFEIEVDATTEEESE